VTTKAPGLPEGLQLYKRTDTFSEETTPKGLLNVHSTKDGYGESSRLKAVA
jgi:hypothetical protein